MTVMLRPRVADVVDGRMLNADISNATTWLHEIVPSVALTYDV